MGDNPTPMEIVATFISKKVKAKKPYKELPMNTDWCLTTKDLMELVKDAKK